MLYFKDTHGCLLPSVRIRLIPGAGLSDPGLSDLITISLSDDIIMPTPRPDTDAIYLNTTVNTRDGLSETWPSGSGLDPHLDLGTPHVLSMVSYQDHVT